MANYVDPAENTKERVLQSGSTLLTWSKSTVRFSPICYPIFAEKHTDTRAHTHSCRGYEPRYQVLNLRTGAVFENFSLSTFWSDFFIFIYSNGNDYI